LIRKSSTAPLESLCKSDPFKAINNILSLNTMQHYESLCKSDPFKAINNILSLNTMQHYDFMPLEPVFGTLWPSAAVAWGGEEKSR
jgi:hypothetical protein